MPVVCCGPEGVGSGRAPGAVGALDASEDVGGGGLSSVENLTPGRSGFQTRRERASAVAIRLPRGDQARVLIVLLEAGVTGGSGRPRDVVVGAETSV